MAANLDKPGSWNQDTKTSVDYYNNWFLNFAPRTFTETRDQKTSQVERVIEESSNLTSLTPDLLRRNPGGLQVLRMFTAPPLAQDRLVGLSGIKKSMLNSMENNDRLPTRMNSSELDRSLRIIIETIEKLLDHGVFDWIRSGNDPSDEDVNRAATVVADRLTGAVSDPIIRNEQERRQLGLIEDFLSELGYRNISGQNGLSIGNMPMGTFAFRMSVAGQRENGNKVQIPIDTVVKRKGDASKLPLLIEAKSAGDFTNPNKRRKEESDKLANLKRTHGGDVEFVLYLCGYFDAGYLGYEAADGIDWVWEHRMEDLLEFGI